MKKLMTVACFALAASMNFVGSALANDASPVGTWKTIDDKTGKVRSLVQVTEVNGELQGKIEKLFLAPEEVQNPNVTNAPTPAKTNP